MWFEIQNFPKSTTPCWTLSDATSLYHFWWRKKKVDGYIIPPKHFYGRVLELAVSSPEIIEIIEEILPEIEDSIVVETPIDIPIAKPVEIKTPVSNETILGEKKVSAFSLASIRAKKELQESNKTITKETVQLPIEVFTETEMLLYWTKYAEKLGENGSRIMESLLLINDPTLQGSKITIELPNEGSKIDFESEKTALLGYLKGHLHNHDITIDVIVNESVENKFAFTAQDKYNRLNELNPSLELLRKTFDLDY